MVKHEKRIRNYKRRKKFGFFQHHSHRTSLSYANEIRISDFKQAFALVKIFIYIFPEIYSYE